jgi:hypothetical protein
MSPVNYRGRIVKVLRQGKHGEYTGIFYRGNRFWAAESRGTESLPTVILDSLVLRGVEDDSETIARLATSAKFRSASMSHKTAMLERHVDIARLFGTHTWDPPSPGTATAGLRTLPTRYLSAYTPAEKLAAMDTVARQRANQGLPLAGSPSPTAAQED